MSETNKDVTIRVGAKDNGLTPTMSKVNGILAQTKIAGDRINSAFAPLRGRVAGFVAAFAGLSLVTRSMNEARGAAEANQKLATALGSNVDQLERIKALADDIQERTPFEGDSVKALAAELLNRGVAVSQIDKALEATIQTAAALNNTIEATGAQVAQTYGGIVPRELGKAVPAIKQLTEEQLRNGAAVDLLIKRYPQFAEALLKTPTGQIAREQNRIGDSLEAIGDAALKIQAGVLPKVAEELQALSNVVQTPAAQKAVDLTIRGVRLLIEYTPRILLFAGAVKVVSVALGTYAAAAAGLKASGAVLTSLKGAEAVLTGIAKTPLGFTALAAGALTAAERVSLIFDNLRGVNTQLDTLEKRRAIVLDVVLKISKGEITATDLGDKILAEVLSQFGVEDSVGRTDAQAVAAGNLTPEKKKQQDEAAAAERARKRELEAQATSAESKDLLARLNEVKESKDAESLDRRTKYELQKTEQLFQLKKISLAEYLKQIEALERADLDRRLAAAQAKDAALQERVNRGERVSKDALAALVEQIENQKTLNALKEEQTLVELRIEQRRKSGGVAAAAETINEVTEAQERYNAELERTAQLLIIGTLTPDQARRRVASAATKADDVRRQAEEGLKSLKENGLITDEEFAEYSAKLDGITDKTLSKMKEALALLREIRAGLQAPFEGFFNSVIDGTKKVSDAFRDLGVDILKTIQQILVSRLTTQFLDAFLGGTEESSAGGFIGGIIGRAFGGAKAAGGPVDPSKFYLVGEEGPELFAPRTRGTIIPNVDVAAAAGRMMGNLRMPAVDTARMSKRVFNTEPPAAAGAAAAAQRAMPVLMDEPTINRFYRAGPEASRRMLIENADIIAQIAKREI